MDGPGIASHHPKAMSAPSIRWRSILLASVCAWIFGFVLIAAIIAAYAFSLGFAARGAPDPAAIQQFANAVGPTWGPRLSIVITGVAALWLGRRVMARPIVHGLLIALIVGGLPYAVSHPFAIEPMLTFAATLLAGAIGGWLGRLITKSPEGSGA
jgi:hypothetical protein